jgi:hypothetical protein
VGMCSVLPCSDGISWGGEGLDPHSARTIEEERDSEALRVDVLDADAETGVADGVCDAGRLFDADFDTGIGLALGLGLGLGLLEKVGPP